jgi:fatty acid desaturase
LAITARTRQPLPADQLVDWQRNNAPSPVLHGSLTLLQVLLWVAAVWTFHSGWFAVLVLVWIASILVSHNKVIAFHEATHGLLQPLPWLNELIGEIIGCVSLVPLTAYRIVHGQHHAYLGTERDVEFWPFVDPSVRLWRRRLAIAAELLLGYFYDPTIILRGTFVARDVPPALRRKAAVEYALCGLIWCLLAVILTWFGWWPEFCVAYFIPAYVAAILNSWRRMVEHLGMLGDTVETKSRTIVPQGRLAAVVSASVLHVDHHGTHHRYGRIPYYHLPEATRLMHDVNGEQAVFPSYWSALRDTLPHVVNPRVGGQWRSGCSDS